MSFISALALVLLTMVGYAMGAAFVSPGKKPHPVLLDVFVVLALIVAALSTPHLFPEGFLRHLAWIGIAMVVGGLLVLPRRGTFSPLTAEDLPAYKNPIMQRWMTFSLKIGNFQSRILLSLLYFTILLPFSAAQTFLGDPMGMKASHKPGWLAWQHTSDTLEKAQREF